MDNNHPQSIVGFDPNIQRCFYCPEILELPRRRPERIHIVRYEDLVLRTDEVLADLRAATALELPL